MSIGIVFICIFDILLTGPTTVSGGDLWHYCNFGCFFHTKRHVRQGGRKSAVLGPFHYNTCTNVGVAGIRIGVDRRIEHVYNDRSIGIFSVGVLGGSDPFLDGLGCTPDNKNNRNARRIEEGGSVHHEPGNMYYNTCTKQSGTDTQSGCGGPDRSEIP
jgi:hypothetical protein